MTTAALDFLAQRIAARVAELLADRIPPALLDAQQVARYLGTDVQFVYEHAAQLGGRRLGDGPKARIRFRLAGVEAALTPIAADPPPAATYGRPPKSTKAASAAPLLPIRGVRP